jgi:phosphoadenosine phosphosulfate reductase
MLIEHDLFRGRIDKVQMAIDRLKLFEPAEGYYLAYSGGKDSDTILALAKMAGVKFDAHYNLTTVDPPELVYHIRKHSEVEIHRPEETMWQIIARKRTLPLRQARFCCELLKEQSGEDRVVVTGIRAAESVRRARRNMNENCYKGNKKYLHVIIDWEDEDVWEFIKGNNIPYCSLYDEGWKRIGCVCCPNSNQKAQAERWPKIAAAYLHAVQRYWPEKQNPKHKTPEAYFQWWLAGKGNKHDEDELFIYE